MSKRKQQEKIAIKTKVKERDTQKSIHIFIKFRSRYENKKENYYEILQKTFDSTARRKKWNSRNSYSKRSEIQNDMICSKEEESETFIKKT